MSSALRARFVPVAVTMDWWNNWADAHAGGRIRHGPGRLILLLERQPENPRSSLMPIW